MMNKFNINFSIKYCSEFQNLKFSKSEAFKIFFNTLTFLLNLMSALRAFHILEPLTQILNPLRLQYVILRTKSQNRCDYCTYIYVHGLCDRNMGLLPASNRHFMVSPHEVFTCFRSAAGSHFIACLPTEEKWSLIGVARCFWQENYDCRTKFNSSLDMEYNGELYGFSAVKVKLVDSLI